MSVYSLKINGVIVMGEFTQRIQLSGVKKSFGPKEVLSAVDLTVNTGEIVGLIGPSGAGKSTVSQMLTD